jgi:hypothetical protein
VVTFEEFLQVMTKLGGEGPAEVRRQGMALATLAVTGDKNLADRILERSEEMTTLPKLIPAELVLQEHVPTTDPAPLAVTKLMDLRADHLMDCRTIKLTDETYYIAVPDAMRKITGQSKATIKMQLTRHGLDTHT